MTAQITAFYASLIAALFLYLSFRVSTYRRSQHISLGEANDSALLARVRAQGNCIEYSVLALFLILVVELNGGPDWTLHGLGAMLVLGRIAHAMGLGMSRHDLRLRAIGMSLTTSQIGLGAVVCMVQALT